MVLLEVKVLLGRPGENRAIEISNMYDFAKDVPVDVERFQERLRKMIDEQLIEYGRACRYMCSPAAYWGKGPRESHVIQLRETIAEWRRRAASSKADLSDKPTTHPSRQKRALVGRP